MKPYSRAGWAILAAMALGISDLRAATYVVNNNTDSGPGSLRQAILDANAGGGGNLDLTGVSGTITLTTNLPPIAASVNILGPGTNVLTVSGSNAWVLFTFQAGTTNTISNLAMTNGSAIFAIPPSPTGDKASGIRNFGTLKMQNCLVGHCRNYATDGGGVYNSGALELDNCLIADCGSDYTYGDVTGGGIYNTGTLNMNGCTIGDYCTAREGGGIYTTGTSVLTQCLITTCGTDDQGDNAGILNGGQLTLIACILTNNRASDFAGGIGSGGTLAMTNTTIVNNSALEGGGLYLSGTVSCLNCTISGNVCGELGGYFGGGGIKNSAILTMLNCTVSGNSCFTGDVTNQGGGGIENFNQLIMTNCTVSGNSNLSFNGAPPAHGGGILTGSNAVTHLTDCTVVSNSAAFAAGMENIAGTVYAADTIIANNGVDFTGLLNSQGHNLIGNTNACVLVGDSTGNLYGVDPLLGPLQNNGGPTLTHALLAGSPAIDAGPANSAPFFDQRGAPRPFGAADDIGAFEFGSVPTLHVALWAPPRNGCLQVNAAGTPGFIYLLQRAPVPSGPWTPLTIVTADSSGAAVWLDMNPPGDRAFYRVVCP